jgi:uncharacterized membrane protein
MGSIRRFFSTSEEQQLLDAIAKAEEKTNGEIRVHLENHAKKDVFERGVEVFHELKMTETQERNGVLFYIAVDDHKFAVVADEGINKVVPDGFWQQIKDNMQADFRKGAFEQGLENAILAAGKALAAYFPKTLNNTNELPNTITTSKQ